MLYLTWTSLDPWISSTVLDRKCTVSKINLGFASREMLFSAAVVLSLYRKFLEEEVLPSKEAGLCGVAGLVLTIPHAITVDLLWTVGNQHGNLLWALCLAGLWHLQESLVVVPWQNINNSAHNITFQLFWLASLAFSSLFSSLYCSWQKQQITWIPFPLVQHPLPTTGVPMAISHFCVGSQC